MNPTDFLDLASEQLGGAVIFANDEFFAPRENLIRAAPPVWREGEYTERGKWMDGWETRRRRWPGHDLCIVRLGLPGEIRGVVVDTSYFTGNYPESCSIDGCTINGPADEPALLDGTTDIAWTEILARSPLQGNTRNVFVVQSPGRYTHLRFNIFPDGGVARLRVHGIVLPDWSRITRAGGEIDLAGAQHGGWVASCSDMHYGNRQNLILPGQSLGMHDGWETKRRRGQGNDWAIVRLGARGMIRRVVVDTSHFKGNAPGACSLDAWDATEAESRAGKSGLGFGPPPEDAAWAPLVPQVPLQPHTVHDFVEEVYALGPVTHVRLNIFPDGGVARLRLYGVLADAL